MENKPPQLGPPGGHRAAGCGGRGAGAGSSLRRGERPVFKLL